MKAIDSHGENLKKINEFIIELDPSVRLEVFRFLLAEEEKQSPKSIVGTREVPPPQSDRNVSPQERLRVCDASSSLDKALILAYWLEEDQKKAAFTSFDLKEAFITAREPAPVNTSDVVAKLDAAGRVMKADKIGKSQSYRLTQTGIEQVQNWLKAKKENENKK